MSHPQSSPAGSPQLQAASSPSAPSALDLKDAQIQELNKRGLALQQQHQDLQAEHAALKAKATLAASKAFRPKINPPRPFVGEGHTAAAAVDDWVDEMERQFDYHGDAAFPDEPSRITFAAMFFQGKAAHWWKAHVAELAKRGEVINTWSAFLSALRDRFRPIEAATVARSNLDSMRQTGGVQAYIDYYLRQMQFITDMSLADQLHAFIRGLNPAIKTEVLKARPKTVSEAVNTAHLVESFLAPRQGGGRGMGFFARSGGYRGGQGVNSGGAVPMEVSNINMQADPFAADGPFDEQDGYGEAELLARIYQLEQSQQLQQQQFLAMMQRGDGSGGAGRGGSSGASSSSGPRQSKGPLVPGISKADYERCRKEKRCLKCKQPGHNAAECDKPVSSNW